MMVESESYKTSLMAHLEKDNVEKILDSDLYNPSPDLTIFQIFFCLYQ